MMKFLTVLIVVVLSLSLVLAKPMRQKRMSLKNFPGSQSGLGIFSNLGSGMQGAGLSGSNFQLANFGGGEDVPEHRSGRRRRGAQDIPVSDTLRILPPDISTITESSTRQSSCERIYGKDSVFCQALACEIDKDHPDCQNSKSQSLREPKQEQGTTHDMCDERFVHSGNLFYCKVWKCEREKGQGHPDCKKIGVTTPQTSPITETTTSTVPIKTTSDLMIDSCERIYGKSNLICAKIKCRKQKGSDHPDCKLIADDKRRKLDDSCDELFGEDKNECLLKKCEDEKGVGHKDCGVYLSFHSTTIEPTTQAVMSEFSKSDEITSETSTTKSPISGSCNNTHGEESELCRKIRCEELFGTNNIKCQFTTSSVKPTTLQNPYTTMEVILDPCRGADYAIRKACLRKKCEELLGIGHPDCSNTVSTLTNVHTPTYTTKPNTFGVSTKELEHDIIDCERQHGQDDKVCKKILCEKLYGVGHKRCQQTTTKTPATVHQRTTKAIKPLRIHCESLHGKKYCQKLKCEREKGLNHPDCSFTSPTRQPFNPHPLTRESQNPIFESCLHMAKSFDSLVSCQRSRCEKSKGKGHPHCQFPFPGSYSQTMSTFLEMKNCEYMFGFHSQICKNYECQMTKGVGHADCQLKEDTLDNYAQSTADACEMIYGKSSSMCMKFKCEKIWGVGHRNCQMKMLMIKSY